MRIAVVGAGGVGGGAINGGNGGLGGAATGGGMFVTSIAGGVNQSTYSSDTAQAGNGETLAVLGVWTNAAGADISATGATLNLGDQNSNSTNAWTNAGAITATNSTVNLGGLFTLAALGNFQTSAAVINLVGTLNDTGTTLALNASTGSWYLRGGTLLNGTLTEAAGAELFITNSGGTFNGRPVFAAVLAVSHDGRTVVAGPQLVEIEHELVPGQGIERAERLIHE